MGTTAWLAAFAGAATWMYMRREPPELRGECALVTGGSRGLGLDVARELAREGCRVGIVARDGAELERAQRALAQDGAHEVEAFVCDLRDPAQIQTTLANVLNRWGRVDILVNNAGVIQVGPLDTMRIEDFEEAMAVHFWAPLHTMRAVIEPMRKQGGGRIVNIASVGGKVAIPHLAPYCASKFALTGLSDAMRAELARDGIRVTTVCPGLMRTGSHHNAWFKGDHTREFAWFSTGASAPFLSVSAQRAARRIVLACRRGERAVQLGLPTKILIGADALAPSLVGATMARVNEVLPASSGPAGEERRRGWESHSRVSPSLLTRLSDRQVASHNQMRH